MSGTGSPAQTLFKFGDHMKVEILQGDLCAPGVAVEAVASSDDNYLTMGSGVSALLMKQAGSMDYVRKAQAQCPVKAGSVVVTPSYGLKNLLGANYVFHAAVIDYDRDVLRLSELVEQATADCLERAETLGLRSILFPAFATGAGKLSMEECARRMCSAIKMYVAQDRLVEQIYILLYRPDEAEARAKCQGFNDRFIREANLVLGVPYDPTLRTRQVRDFYGGDTALQRLEQIITGQCDDETCKQHAVILGGPFVGKWALLDHLYYLAEQPGSPLSAGRKLVKLTFGRVHESTPTSFIYRKLLCALGKAEQGTDDETRRLVRKIRRVYSDPELDGDRFLAFLDQHPDRYGEVVFLIDKLPRLLKMEAQAGADFKGMQAFWQDLDRLQRRVRFIYTAWPADYQQLREQRLDPYASAFQSRIEALWLSCVTDTERERWVDELFSRYLDRPGGAPRFVQARFAVEAGRHPYLISLLGYALIEALKRDALANPKHPVRYTIDFMARFFQAACNAIEEPRRTFFELLMGVSTPDDRSALEALARAEAIEAETKTLIREVAAGEPKAITRMAELQAQGDLRKSLNDNALLWLEAQGYLVDVKKQARFMAPAFGAWVAGYFGVGRRPREAGQPLDAQISLLSVTESSGPQAIRTMFRGRGARIVTAQKELRQEDKRDFTEGFGKCISHLLHPVTHPDPGWLQDAGQVGNFVLTQFTTSEIKRYLQDPPADSTILFEVDDALKDIPWELMLETAYAGEIPFRVGRRVIGQQPANISPVVRGIGKVKALLIGDPSDNLSDARDEVKWLADRLQADGRFEEPDILLGAANCQPGPILSALGSKKYGLLHYSGHTKFDGYRSAWQLADGKMITTDRLTSALQMGPPTFVFSSSCESGAGGPSEAIRYENQTFDLPSAFLQAGVEVYVGTLWEVEAAAARRFVMDFYEAFLNGEWNLGECLRRAKWARKQDEQYADRINWLSFILYGDPHLASGELFPALKK